MKVCNGFMILLLGVALVFASGTRPIDDVNPRQDIVSEMRLVIECSGLPNRPPYKKEHEVTVESSSDEEAIDDDIRGVKERNLSSSFWDINQTLSLERRHDGDERGHSVYKRSGSTDTGGTTGARQLFKKNSPPYFVKKLVKKNGTGAVKWTLHCFLNKKERKSKLETPAVKSFPLHFNRRLPYVVPLSSTAAKAKTSKEPKFHLLKRIFGKMSSLDVSSFLALQGAANKYNNQLWRNSHQMENVG